MQARFIETFQGFPRVEIMPDGGDFNGIDGRIEVCFFESDIDTGKRVYKPYIFVNVSFVGRMQPEQAAEWGNCFNAAYAISVRGMPKYLDGIASNEVVNAFARVDELRLGSRFNR